MSDRQQLMLAAFSPRINTAGAILIYALCAYGEEIAAYYTYAASLLVTFSSAG